MKRIIASAGIVALGAASVHAAGDMGLSQVETKKAWNVSALLRAFADDNYLSSPKGRDTLGFEVSPSVKFNHINDQTTLRLGYTFDLRYYDDKSKADKSHTIDFNVDHKFSEIYSIKVDENFVMAQEPQLIDASSPIITVPLRANGDNMHNAAGVSFTAQINPTWGLVVGYKNSIYDYDAKGAGSFSAFLDRQEHLGSVNVRYRAWSSTTLVLGYQYGAIHYTSKDDLQAPGFGTLPNSRDNRSDYAVVGFDHFFTPQLNMSVRVGEQWVEYHKVTPKIRSSSPYADAMLGWAYKPDCQLVLGVRHQRNQTDIAYLGFGPVTATPTLDQESTAIYGSISHKITPKLTGNLLVQYQNSSFNSGGANNVEDDLYTLGINFGYQFTTSVAAEAGYNYDKLDSGLDKLAAASIRGFERNRGYVGIRLSY